MQAGRAVLAWEMACFSAGFIGVKNTGEKEEKPEANKQRGRIMKKDF